MTATKKLYRIVEQHRYDGGNGRDELQNETVLYCGYDKDEARRVFHANSHERRHAGPGNYYVQIVSQSKTCSED